MSTMDDKITERKEPYGSEYQDNNRAASPVKPKYEESSEISPQTTFEDGYGTAQKRTLWERVKEPGSVWQIIIAALAGIAIGLIVTTTVGDVPEACIALLAIPGQLWLRALQAVGMHWPTPYPSNVNLLTPYTSAADDCNGNDPRNPTPS